MRPGERDAIALGFALGVRLGGTNRYATHTEHRPLLGDGRAPSTADIVRAVLLSRLIGLASLVACSLLDSFPGLGTDHIRLAVRTPAEPAVLVDAIARALDRSGPPPPVREPDPPLLRS